MGRKILSYFIVLVLIVAILLSIITTVVSLTILDENYISKTLAKVNYEQEIYNEIMETFKDNTIQSGLEENVLEGIITQEQINEDVNNFIQYLYEENKPITVQENLLRTKLEENINQQIEEKDKRLTDDEEEAIDTYINTIVKIYKNGIIYSESKIPSVKDIITKSTKIVSIAQIASYITAVVALIIIIAVNKQKSIKHLAIALLSVGIALIALKIAEINSVSINNILILNKAFSDFIIAVINNIMQWCLISGIISAVIGLITSIISVKVIEE